MRRPASSTPERHEAASYEIRLEGHLDARWAAQLDATSLIHESDGTTVISILAADQSRLHGLLQRIRDLALPLVSVTRLRPADPEQPSTLPAPLPNKGH